MKKLGGLARVVAAAGCVLFAWSGCISIRYFEDADGTDSVAKIETETKTETETETETEAPPDGGDSEDALPCPAALGERLSVTEVNLDDDVHYVRPGYNRIPVPARVILAARPDGTSIVAWLNAAMNTVHITPLDKDLDRDGDDVSVPGVDLGGVVAHDDGFALLTRRVDTGEDVAVDVSDSPAHAAVLLRYMEGEEAFEVSLTGTDGVDGAADYSNFLRGQLAWVDKTYAAYFEVRSGTGTAQEGRYGDKLVLIDPDGGPLPGGWRFVTGTVTGLSLLYTEDIFGAFALTGGGSLPGVVISTSPDDTTLIAREETWNGYNGADFGGAVSSDLHGHALAFASRGYDLETEQALGDAHDVALLRLSDKLTSVEEARRITATLDVDEINVHIAPYGEEHLLIIWSRVVNLDCREVGTCFGNYDGTLMQRFSWDGEPVGEPEPLQWPPTSEQSIVRFENGDLAFAQVDDEPDYSTRLERLYDDEPPAKKTLRIVRLRYCHEEGRR